MGNKVEQVSDLGKYRNRFIFFPGPCELWVDPTQSDLDIFFESGNEFSHDIVVGSIVISPNEIQVNASGSQAFHIEPKSPEPVVKFIQGLPGATEIEVRSIY